MIRDLFSIISSIISSVFPVYSQSITEYNRCVVVSIVEYTKASCSFIDRPSECIDFPVRHLLLDYFSSDSFYINISSIDALLHFKEYLLLYDLLSSMSLEGVFFFKY